MEGKIKELEAKLREDVTLHVGNLLYEMEENAVRLFFEQYGKVKKCYLPKSRDTHQNANSGFAFVIMPVADAWNACEKANGVELNGRTYCDRS